MQFIRGVKRIVESVYQKGFFHLLSSNFLVHFLSFSSQLIVAWILTAEDLGRIKLMLSYVEVALIIATFGIPVSVVKLCSSNILEKLKLIILRNGFIYITLSSSLTYLVLLVMSESEVISSDIVINQYFKYFALLLFPMSWNQLFISFFQSKKKFKELSIIQTTTKFASILVIVGVTYFFLLEGYILAIVVGFFLTTVIFIFHLRGQLSDLFIEKLRSQIKIFKQVFSYSKYSLAANLTNRLNIFVHYFILNYYLEDRELFGQYSFALTLVQGLQIITTTIQQITIPYFSEYSQDIQTWKNSFSKYNKIFIGLIVVVFAFSMLVLPEIVKIIFAGKFNDSIIFIRIFVGGWLIRNLYSLKGPALIGLGKIHVNFYNSFYIFVLTVPFVFTLIKFYGSLGAAYSSVLQGIIAYMIVSISFQKVVRKSIRK